MNFITRVMVLEKRRMKKEAASPMSNPSPMSKGAPFSPEEEEDESPEEVAQEVKEKMTNTLPDGPPQAGKTTPNDDEEEMDDEDAGLDTDEANVRGSDATPSSQSDKAKKLAKAGQKHPATTDTGWRDKLTGKPTFAPKGTSAFASDKVNASKKSKSKSTDEDKDTLYSGSKGTGGRKVPKKGAKVTQGANVNPDGSPKTTMDRDDKEDFRDDVKEKKEPKKDNDWIQKAVNPDHEGYCTPMTKSTCTPRRKALAKTFKKMGRKRDKEIKAKDEK